MIKEATPTKSGQAPRPRWNRDRLRDPDEVGTGFATKGVRRGFTLLEIVVVISLILFLVGLTLTVGVTVIERSEITQTENTMRLLDMALQEWEIAADRKLSWGKNFQPNPPGIAVYDLQGDPTGLYLPSITDDIFIISELLDTVARPSQVKGIIANIDPEFVHTYEPGPPYPSWIRLQAEKDAIDATWGVMHGPPGLPPSLPPSLAILDAWGTPIYSTHPGPTSASVDRDDDGTMRIQNETVYGIAVNRQVCFVSAGPDGRFGIDTEFDLTGDELAEAMRKARADNIYSYQPIRPPEWDE